MVREVRDYGTTRTETVPCAPAPVNVTVAPLELVATLILAIRSDLLSLLAHDVEQRAPVVEELDDRLELMADDVLWRMVEDVTCSLDVRAGAALALRSGLDEEGVERLRAAGRACASPRLRAVLEAVSKRTDDNTLDSRLEALEASARTGQP